MISIHGLEQLSRYDTALSSVVGYLLWVVFTVLQVVENHFWLQVIKTKEKCRSITNNTGVSYKEKP